MLVVFGNRCQYVTFATELRQCDFDARAGSLPRFEEDKPVLVIDNHRWSRSLARNVYRCRIEAFKDQMNAVCLTVVLNTMRNHVVQFISLTNA
mgnify:FL=1